MSKRFQTSAHLYTILISKQTYLSTTSNQLIKLLGKDIVFYLADGEVLDTPHIFSVTEENLESCISENEKAVAGWVLKNNKRAGSTTGTLSNAKCLYLAVQIGRASCRERVSSPV